MTPHPDDINAQIEIALISLQEQRGEEFSRHIKAILYANLDRGRVNAFIEGDIHQVHDYVARIVTTYERLAPYIRELQIERLTTVWEPLFEKLQLWALLFLLKHNFYRNSATMEMASERANEAAINILTAHFPFDTDFEPWANTIVQFTCLKYFQKEMRKSVIPSHCMVELDDTLDNLADPMQNQEQSQDSRFELLEACSQLSDARRRTIELLYFDGLSPKEVAEALGKSIGAIYSLQFNALQDLRKILGKNRDKHNE